MEKFKTYKDIEVHLDKILEENSVKVEEAKEEVTEKMEKKEESVKYLNTTVSLTWQEAYLVTMVLKKEIMFTQKNAYSTRDSEYLVNLRNVFYKMNECHYAGLKKWFKTIESDDPKEWNMFKLYSYDNE